MASFSLLVNGSARGPFFLLFCSLWWCKRFSALLFIAKECGLIGGFDVRDSCFGYYSSSI